MSPGIQLWLSAASVGPYSLRMAKYPLPGTVAARNIVSIRNITVVDMREFRSSWKLSARTSGKQLERLKRFFNFCVDNGDDWLEVSPTRKLKPPTVMDAEVVPFSEEEVTKILKACSKRKTDKDAMTDARRLRLLAQLLLATGLRIGDAVMLRTDKIFEDRSKYSVVLRTAKTGSHVACPIEPTLAKELLSCAPHPFWTGRSKVEACTSLWREVFSNVFKEAGVVGHLHQFRHTFAKRLLISGVPVGLVSILLGHARVAITEKHYSRWIPERQAALTEAVRQSWTGTPAAHQ
jgi:integrase